MIIFGWGKKGREVPLNPTQRLVMRYTYIHVFWLLTAAWGRQYHLATLTEQGWALRPVDDSEAAMMCGGEPPELSPWKQYSLPGALALLVVFTALSISLAG